MSMVLTTRMACSLAWCPVLLRGWVPWLLMGCRCPVLVAPVSSVASSNVVDGPLIWHIHIYWGVDTGWAGLTYGTCLRSIFTVFSLIDCNSVRRTKFIPCSCWPLVVCSANFAAVVSAAIVAAACRMTKGMIGGCSPPKIILIWCKSSCLHLYSGGKI